MDEHKKMDGSPCKYPEIHEINLIGFVCENCGAMFDKEEKLFGHHSNPYYFLNRWE